MPLPDGRHDIVLLGACRARIARMAAWRQSGFDARREELRTATPAAPTDGAAPPAPRAP
ncbi:MAG: hypothetical protein ACKOHI_09610 [Phycisphaerales bacterium]